MNDITTIDAQQTASDARSERAGVLADRVFTSLVPALELLSIELGTRRGLYRALERLGTANVAEFALECGIVERYAREWLEQQAAAGIVDVAAAGDAATRRYALPAAHADVLLDGESPFAMAGAASFLVGIAQAFEGVVADFGAGRGVPYPEYGAAARHAISSLNRPAFVHALEEWLRALPDVDERLRSAPGVILDAGCGTGWSTLALARAYPLARVIGIDLDAASIAEAEAHLAESGIGDRVAFTEADAGDVDVLRALAPDGAALVTVFEALHDMNAPTRALAALGAALEPSGAILVADEKVADRFMPDGDFLERLNYAFSVLHCLPSTIAEGDGEANGTVLRAPVIERWVTETGLARLTALDIDNDLWRFYRIDPR